MIKKYFPISYFSFFRKKIFNLKINEKEFLLKIIDFVKYYVIALNFGDFFPISLDFH